jgi:hypothetical protein
MVNSTVRAAREHTAVLRNLAQWRFAVAANIDQVTAEVRRKCFGTGV